MSTLVERPFRLVATGLAYIAKLSALHPIHTLVVTSLFASFTYLAIVEDYIGEGFKNSNEAHDGLISYFRESSTGTWTPVLDWSTITPDAEHYNVIPVQFKRVGEFQIPEIDGSFNDAENEFVKYVVAKDDDSESVANQLVSQDGTVWKFRNYHTKLGAYSELVIKGYNKVLNLIKGAETFDIAVVTVAYIAMYYTFVSLFLEMRKLGSKFWLGFATLVSSCFAFLFALYTTTQYLHLDIPVLSLTEGIPFFVATIGYKRKVLLTQKVLTKYSTKEYVRKGSQNVLFHALKDEGTFLLRDHLITIFAFLGCSAYASHLKGLHNFCILSALILAFDLLTTITFLSAILALKLEINIIHRANVLQQALQEDGLTDEVVDDVLRSNSLAGGRSFHDSTSNGFIFAGKIASVAAFFGIHFLGLGSAWLTDLNAKSEYKESLVIDQLILNTIPTNAKGTLITLFPSRFFLPSDTFHIEDAILSTIGHISAAIRDRYISKFVLFSFAISVTINVYLLNTARIHTSALDKNIDSRKEPGSKKSKSVTVAPKDTPLVATKEDQVTKSSEILANSSEESENEQPARPLDELVTLYKDGKVKSLYNDEIVSLVTNGKLPLYALETKLGDTTRAVAVRRKAIAKLADAPVLETNKLPYLHYDYDRVFGACCENVIGYVPLPVGIAGPLIIDGKPFHIPMATTEGCLVASAMRGCKAINLGGGVTTVLTKDGMTRGPCVSFPSLQRAGACKIWLDSEEGQTLIKKAFNSTSRFARLQHIQTALAGDLLFIRFRTTTGDAMGMNMISKGVEFALKQMIEELGWDDMQVISVSGNYCTDKKPAAINWIEGRGKSVVAEAIIDKDDVQKILKTDVKSLVQLNINKNLIGSAMAGAVGGFNAQAANLLTSVFLALGQDPAQNVESSNCITLMKETESGDLQVSVSMPCIEVGTIGGGTILDPQGAMLELLGVRGPAEVPGDNARQLAKIIASIVLAGELSLCSALAAGHLVQSHMTLNRASKK